MINKIGSRLLLVGQEVFLGGASVISSTERQTKNYINLTMFKQCFATHISVLLLNVVISITFYAK